MPARKKVSSSESPTKIPKGSNDGPSAFGPVNAGAVVHAKTATRKQPPPESAESVRIRTAVVLSFWAVVVFLGLPTWWKTTAIYRAKLPLREMTEWADGKVCRPVFPLRISIEARFLQELDAQHLLRTTQHALDDHNDFSAHHLRLQLSRSSQAARNVTARAGGASSTGTEAAVGLLEDQEDHVALLVRLLPGESGSPPNAILQPYSPTLEVFYPPNQIPSTSSTSSPLASFIASKLQEIFAEEQAIIAHILSNGASGTNAQTPGSSGIVGHASQNPQPAQTSARESRSPLIKALPADLQANLVRRTTRSLKYSPTYHLTFSLFTPGASPSSWDIESAIEQYLSPLLESFAPISNFTIDTQVQLYASFSPSVRDPEFDPDINSWTLRTEDLSGFINAAEWPLSPSIGGAPTINFVLYVPAADRSPLVVKENRGNSWLVPQWGGVVILNPPTSDATAVETTSHLPNEVIRPALLTFSHQLLSLLGTPQSPSSLPLRLLTLTRVRSASLLLSASSTLGSLARLTLALPSISIPRTVAVSVDRTLSHLHDACIDLRDGRFQRAFENARIAEAEAERGFFEKSMVGKVYSPDEHKVAVYLPLLGPVGVPLVMYAGKEIVRVWRGWKMRRAGKGST
ncbi:MAG: GPI transamidase component [Geoglossum umbratile]|nr:MAG: GPI transamidase component [Geoglossum umbratile]